MVEMRNVRQLKAGEFRKRPGFSRVDPLETLIVDNETFRRAPSVLSHTQWSTDAATNFAVTTEVTSASNQKNFCIPWHWPAFGAARCVVGVTGLFTVATNSAIIRLRTGGTGPPSLGASGTVAASLTVPVGADQLIDLVSSEFTPPVTTSYLQLTLEAAAGTSDVTPKFLNIWAAPVGGGQMMAVASAMGWATSFSELVRQQWLVDFDQFDADVSNVTLTLAMRGNNGPSATDYRIRVGGTLGANDGTVAILHSRSADGGGGNPNLSTASATIAKPSGIQLIKGSLAAGLTGGDLNTMSLLIKAA